MTSRSFYRASLVALGVAAALNGNSAWAQAPNQKADTEELNEITVTGSR